MNNKKWTFFSNTHKITNIYFIGITFFLCISLSPAVPCYAAEFEFGGEIEVKKEESALTADAENPTRYQAGIVGGIPIGLSGRWWLTDRRAVNLHWGIEYIPLLQISHIWKFTKFPSELSDINDYFDAYYIGAGGVARFGEKELVGFRVPLGLSRNFSLFRIPLYAAVEVTPVYRLSPSFGFNLHASIAIEYRFTDRDSH